MTGMVVTVRLLRVLVSTWPGRVGLSLVVGVIGLIVVSNVALWMLARGQVVNDVDQLIDRLDRTAGPAVVIVPGARVFPDGRPSRPLRDRLDSAAELHALGVVDHVLVSGDNRVNHYDEPTVMRREIHRAGVPLTDITVDYAGFSTWDTCARASEIFGVTQAVFVTQERYARRAGSLCQAADLDVTVLTVPNPPPFPRRVWVGAVLREPVAAVKGFYEVVVQPEPVFLGRFEGLPGSVNPANPDPELGEVSAPQSLPQTLQ